MFITFIKETLVDDISRLPKRAFGQLRKRVRRVDINLTQADGTVTTTPTYGKPHFAFPVQAMVDLPEDMAREFINSGAADITENPPDVRFVTAAEILDGIATEGNQ